MDALSTSNSTGFSSIPGGGEVGDVEREKRMEEEEEEGKEEEGKRCQEKETKVYAGTRKHSTTTKKRGNRGNTNDL